MTGLKEATIPPIRPDWSKIVILMTVCFVVIFCATN